MIEIIIQHGLGFVVGLIAGAIIWRLGYWQGQAGALEIMRTRR